MFVDATADRFIAGVPGGVTPLVLQKLLYYAQGWHLATHNEPLFNEDIQAWRYGPVVVSIYRRFRQFGEAAIPIHMLKTKPAAILAEPVLELLDWVIERYGGLSALDLMRKTHQELPWRETWGERSPDDEGHDVISLDRLQNFSLIEQNRLAHVAQFAPVKPTADLIAWAQGLPAAA